MQTVVKGKKIIGPCHKRLVEREGKRVSFFHIMFFILPTKVGLFSELARILFR
ncbi:hypothetical protein M080_3153 [Bacteroides fragilis str. 3397 T10]|nr:hypothetical protein M080_3153 [Bacteroides fragilis str. 3397 T10]